MCSGAVLVDFGSKMADPGLIWANSGRAIGCRTWPILCTLCRVGATFATTQHWGGANFAKAPLGRGTRCLFHVVLELPCSRCRRSEDSQTWPELDPIWPEFGKLDETSPEFDQTWPKLCEIGPNPKLSRHRQSRPNLARTWSDLARSRPNLAPIFSSSTRIDPEAANFGLPSTKSDPILAELGPPWEAERLPTWNAC